ncbi:hypothetical protein ONS95_008377 [Cadophora gregata]|uniref:uncharacterized protein n=1 Tax=Cadophora gregata TaxID=51156 RepID=UPI0026DB512E|nr:uncharacterized protein ONS95_008377 [Cadophora gregata]KAK0126797.1 hypothetical protein ONS95_008377 [Cadophora gregata]
MYARKPVSQSSPVHSSPVQSITLHQLKSLKSLKYLPTSKPSKPSRPSIFPQTHTKLSSCTSLQVSVPNSDFSSSSIYHYHYHYYFPSSNLNLILSTSHPALLHYFPDSLFPILHPPSHPALPFSISPCQPPHFPPFPPPSLFPPSLLPFYFLLSHACIYLFIYLKATHSPIQSSPVLPYPVLSCPVLSQPVLSPTTHAPGRMHLHLHEVTLHYMGLQSIASAVHCTGTAMLYNTVEYHTIHIYLHCKSHLVTYLRRIGKRNPSIP